MSVVARGDDTEPEPRRASERGTPAEQSFAQTLDRLIRTVHPSNRGPFTMEEIAEGVVAAGGPRFTPGYISHLRTGRKTGPSLDLVVALARFFDVPLSEFDPRVAVSEEARRERRTERKLQSLLAKLREIRHPDQIDAVAAVVESFLRRDPAERDVE